MIKFKTAYVLKHARFNYPAGTVCYKFGGATYGLVGDDERESGIEHVAMTVHADGMTHPFFTVPGHYLEEAPQ